MWNNATTFGERYLALDKCVSAWQGYTSLWSVDQPEATHAKFMILKFNLTDRVNRNRKYYWLKGADLTFYQSSDALLRYNHTTNTVETSGGVTIKRDTFMTLCERFLDDPHRIVGKHVDSFKVNRYDNFNDTLYIGCHSIQISTIRKLYKTLTGQE